MPVINYSYNTFIQLKNSNKNIDENIKLKLDNILKIISNNLIVYKKKNEKYNNSINIKHKQKHKESPKEIWRIKKTVFKKEIKTNNEKYENIINSLLNKLSPSNLENIFAKIKHEFSNIVNESESKEDLELSINNVINNIFSKAVMQPLYCCHYVKLIKILNEIYIIIDLINDKIIDYKQTILKQNIIKNDLNETEKYDEFCKEVKNKVFKEGYSQFIGELYNNDILSRNIAVEHILFFIENLETHFENNDNDNLDNDYIEYNIICCIKLIVTLKIDYNIIKKYLQRFFDISNKKITKRLKFKLLDLKDNINIK